MRLAKSGFNGGVTIDGLKIVDMRFMDNIDLINECCNQSKVMAIRMDTACVKWGLKLNTGMTKSMCSSKESLKMEIPFSREITEQVICFTYLGGNLTLDNTTDSELNRRQVNIYSAFNKLWHSLFSHKGFSISLKMKVSNTSIIHVLLYGSECWTLTKTQSDSLAVTSKGKVKIILGKSQLERIRNNKL